MIHCSLRETGAVMPAACTDCSRCSLQNEEEVLDATHVSPSTCTLSRVAYERGISQIAVWCTLHEEQLYLFHVQFARATAMGQ
jgi:hypothetical protein